MAALAEIPVARKITAWLFAVTMSGTLFYLPYSWSMPAPILMPGYAPHILYVMLGDPAKTICGVLDGIDGNGSPISGVVMCSGDRMPPDDPRFPRTRRLMREWT